MKFACKCLNFIIDVSGPQQPVDSLVLQQLSHKVKTLPLAAYHYEKVEKTIDMLVGLCRLQNWTEFHCRNCSLWMYATKGRDTDSSHPRLIIVNRSTLTTPEKIEGLKKHQKYSNIFKIILLHDSGNDAFSAEQTKLLTLAKIWIDQQTEMIEARIKQFADQQYSELEALKSRAHFEQAAIRRAVAIDEQREAAAAALLRQRLAKQANSNSSTSREHEHTRLVDGVLEFDESVMFSESRPTLETSQTNSDGSDEDIDELPPQPRRVTEPAPMARSLPIPVPQFMEEPRPDERQLQSPQTPSDIAANIRALARSVHGNPIFGELPRPPLTKD